ncbi:MAG: helix-turn-helix domain-containing protein [Treponema sp.]|nr:helix-turn-helix domain-containing protein [Treponema sp.]
MDSHFKQILKDELAFQNLTVKELAYKANISPRTLEGYLSTRSSIPPADVAVRIAKSLNVSVEYLITGTRQTHAEEHDHIESRLIKNLNQLTDRDKKVLLALSETLASLGK